jgi:hypothetical protein
MAIFLVQGGLDLGTPRWITSCPLSWNILVRNQISSMKGFTSTALLIVGSVVGTKGRPKVKMRISLRLPQKDRESNPILRVCLDISRLPLLKLRLRLLVPVYVRLTILQFSMWAKGGYSLILAKQALRSISFKFFPQQLFYVEPFQL